jgi:hypothetical protein
VVQRLTVVREAGGAIWHQALALGGTHRNAQIGFARLAEQALAAFCGVQRDDVVTRFDAGHAFTHFDDDARTFVAQDDREQTFGIITRQGERIGMANAGMRNFDQTSPCVAAPRRFRRFPVAAQVRRQQARGISSCHFPFQVELL